MGKTKKEEKTTFAQSTLDRAFTILKSLGKPSTSHEISIIMGIKDLERGRALVRRVMTKLAEQGKVKITKEGHQYRYSVA